MFMSGAEYEAVFNLHCPNGPPELRESFGFSRQEVGRIATMLVVDHLGALCSEWKKIHGGF
jgi:hypothetical protein